MYSIAASSSFIDKPPSNFPFYNPNRPLFTIVRASSSSVAQEIDKSAEKTSTEEKEGRKFPPLKAAKRVVLVRHGQSTWNAEGRIQGSSDFSVLTSKGESQAETSRQMLIDDSFDVCFSSPLRRSKRTAEIIWGTREEEIITDSDMREIDLYSFQGLLKHEGKAKYGDAFRQWQIDAPNFIIDGHYPVRELWARAKSCWDKILVHESKSVLVVAHNAVNQALVATAIGLGTEYFRILLQSNCGVSVLDFTPQPEGGTPNICLNRLNQTPGSPVAVGSSAGRKTSKRIVLVCHGVSESNLESNMPYTGNGPLNMLGNIQAQKIAELLLDLKVNTVVSGNKMASAETADIITKDASGLQNVPSGWLSRLEDDVTTSLVNQSGKAWKHLLSELSKGSDGQDNIVIAVGHPALHIAMMGHCLNLTKEWLGSFHLNAGSISVIDFPDGPSGRGVIRCINYTAHLGRWSIPITRTTQADEEY
ncbi:2-carboxy-D-arabinitol-1-phosphatase [Capsicum baccatum]|uniref:2-carboxy-D-arabinitol-1-phosphatase n=1 Tax=Capsicum baccatum TaxID=33114 RepID=A0A2G2VAS2_CAPBA|nr:2-carboxy-D-arabinitol-1-phosphatase [Capsicum baccatum]